MTDPAGSPVDPAGGVTGPPAPAASDELTEVVVESEVLRRGHYLTFRVDTIERADGTRAKREVVGHPGAVAILAIDEADNVLMVRQFRIPAGRALLEVPAGTLDVDPLTGAIEDPALAAPRELEEETGYRAGSWRLLTSFWTAPGFATEYMHLYLATDLQPAHDDRLGPDEDERLQLERVPWQEAIDRAERGDIADAKSLIALLWLDRLTQPTLAESAAAAEIGAAPPDATGSDWVVRTHFTTTLAESARVSLAYAQRAAWPRVIGLIALFMAIAFALTSYPSLAIGLGLFGILLATGIHVVPFAIWTYRRRPDIFAAGTEFAAGPDGILYQSPTGRSELTWQTFTRIREGRAIFFLETGISVLFVPKRAFTPGQLSDFRRLIAEAGFGPDGRRR